MYRVGNMINWCCGVSDFWHTAVDFERVHPLQQYHYENACSKKQPSLEDAEEDDES